VLNYDNITGENKMLKERVYKLEEELQLIANEFEETRQRYNQYEINYKNKEVEIESFKENFDIMKKKQLEIANVLELFEQENMNLKKLLNEKKNYIEELVEKIETLKLEFQDRINVIEREYDGSKVRVIELQNKIDDVYKIKVRALKSKLKEKVELISEIERKYQYEKEKRGLY
jgi:chromosome segregation ATPase